MPESADKQCNCTESKGSLKSAAVLAVLFVAIIVVGLFVLGPT